MMLLKHLHQSRGIKYRIIRNLINDVRQIGKQIALVLVAQDGGDTSGVEFNVVVVDFDEVDGGVGGDEGFEGFLDYLRYDGL